VAFADLNSALQKKKSALPVGPVMLGFFLFVVVGSGEQSTSFDP
jgi:hypothetical protein